MEYNEKLEVAAKLFKALAALPTTADFDDISDCIADVLDTGSRRPWNQLPSSAMTRGNFTVTVRFGQGDGGPAMVVRAKRISDGVSGAVYYYG